MGGVHEAVEDGIGDGRITDYDKMPLSFMEWYRRFGLLPAVMHCLGGSFR